MDWVLYMTKFVRFVPCVMLLISLYLSWHLKQRYGRNYSLTFRYLASHFFSYYFLTIKWPLKSCYVRYNLKIMLHSQNIFKTRMHSSRMRTTRSLTASRSISQGGMHAWGGGACVPGRHACLGGACTGGHACPGDVCLGGHACLGGGCSRVCVPRGHACMPSRACVPCMPPVDRNLDTRLWKHYLPTTTVAAGNKEQNVKDKIHYFLERWNWQLRNSDN